MPLPVIPKPVPAKKPGPNFTMERELHKIHVKESRYYERLPDGKPRWVSWNR